MLISKSYDEVKDMMMPGDTLAFGGKTRASRLIKFGTQTAVSHVGMVLEPGKIIEATTLSDRAGVHVREISKVLYEYDGEIWYIPLATDVRSELDVAGLQAWLMKQEGKPYDFVQAGLSAVDIIDNFVMEALQRESFAKLFCSELNMGALKYNGVKRVSHLNASDITPIDYCRFNLHDISYYQIKGEEKIIRGYRAIIPTRWSY